MEVKFAFRVVGIWSFHASLPAASSPGLGGIDRCKATHPEAQEDAALRRVGIARPK
jgi:hypothetical protein